MADLVQQQINNNLHLIQALTSFRLVNEHNIDIGGRVREKAGKFLRQLQDEPQAFDHHSELVQSADERVGQGEGRPFHCRRVVDVGPLVEGLVCLLSGGGKNSLSGGVASPRMGAAHDGLPKIGVMKAGEFW